MQEGPCHRLTNSDLLVNKAKAPNLFSNNHILSLMSTASSRRSRRRLSYLRRHPPAPALSPCTLADVLHEAPRLLDFLPSECRSALLACSRQWRQLIHSTTQTLTVNNTLDFLQLGKLSFSQLALVLVPDYDGNLDTLLKVFRRYQQRSTLGRMQLLAGLSLSNQQNDCFSTVALIVKPATALPQPQTLSQAMLPVTTMSYLQSWTRLKDLTLRQSNLDVDGIAQLTVIDWPELRVLDVAENQLGRAGVAQLAKGAWPKLEELDLDANNLDAAALASVVQGAWPHLQELSLSDNPIADVAAIAVLHTASWPNLTRLTINKVRLDAASVQELVQIPWQHMYALYLSQTSLGTAGVAVLSEANWPSLHALDLSRNDLDLSAIDKLVNMSIPCLTHLDLSRNRIDAAAVKRLATGDWPDLRVLGLHNNCLDDAAMRYLAQGNWPECAGCSLIRMNSELQELSG